MTNPGLKQKMEETERLMVIAALQQTRTQVDAAKKLKIGYRSLRYLIYKHGIERADYWPEVA